MYPSEFGGQGLPKLIATPCIEMLNAANMSFALCPLLTDGAIEALLTAGSDEQKARYLPKFIDGEWTGTMNLTEPQAGSDLAQVRTRAVPQGDGTYKVFGTKIFITYGEHDMAKNIVHLVLARTPDAPEGVKGISLFIVPKFLVNEDGSLGGRNDVHCVSIEHKLGIKVSPTAVLPIGRSRRRDRLSDRRGKSRPRIQFIMMNAARFAVGMQGVAVAERAYQQAVAYAKDRVQSRPVDGSAKEPVSIIHHPDMRRMFSTMRAYTEGVALAYVAASHNDLAHAQRRRGHAATRPFTSISCRSSRVSARKCPSRSRASACRCTTAWASSRKPARRSISATRAFCRSTKARPRFRRTIVGRKTARDRGRAAQALLAQIDQTIAALADVDGQVFKSMHRHLSAGSLSLARTVEFVVAKFKSDPNAVFAGTVLCGWQMARTMLVSHARLREDERFHSAKIATAEFYAEHILSHAPGSKRRSSTRTGSKACLRLAKISSDRPGASSALEIETTTAPSRCRCRFTAG